MSEVMKLIAKKTVFQADKQIEIQEQEEEKIATWEESIKYRNKWAVMDNSKEVQKEFSLGCDLSELSQFGPGLRLFFEFLKYSAVVFLILGLMSIPALVGNADGSSLNSIQLSTNSLSKLSISNQPKLELLVPAKGASASDVQTIKDANNAIIQSFADKAGNRLLQVAIPDIIYSVVFLLFVAWFISHSKKIEKESEQHNLVPSKYTIEVSGFPSSVTDSKVISSHFRDNFGFDIFECQIAHNYYNTLFLHKEEAHLIDAIKLEKSRAKTLNISEDSKLTKLALKLQKVQDKISKQVATKYQGKTLSHSEYPSIKAFVIFNNYEDKIRLQKEYNNMWKCLCWTFTPKKFKLLGKHKLKISFFPDEPSNILWENIEVTKASRFGRTLLVLVLVLIVMLISFGVIILANLVKPTETSSCPSNKITFSEASTSTLYTKCYCMGLSFSEMTSNNTIQNLCWDIWVQYALTYALTIVTGIVIMLVNILLQKVIEALGKFNRYNTITKFSTSMTTKLFLAFFVNTALITLFMQANIFGFIPSVILTYPIYPLSKVQNNRESEYSQDFDRDWYLSIGSKITVTVFFFILTHICFEFLFAPIQKWLKERRVRQLVGKDIQRIANKNIIGPQFTITFYYGSALNIIFTCLFYSSGIPILLFTGFFILTVQYWVYKYRLLRICCRPPSYDIGLNKRILSILPWSLLLHLAIGIYMYGQPLIFPRSSSQLVQYMNYITTSSTTDYEVGVTVNESNVIVSRAYNVLYLMILLFVVAGILACYITFQSVQLFLGNLFSKSNQIMPISQSRLYSEEYSNIETTMIPSYNIKMNDEYRLIIQAIDLGHKVDSELTPKRSEQSPQGSEINFNEDKDITEKKNVAELLKNI